ncbi:MAG: COX15/CtaA family protein [Bryobacterales bacterium]|nr:COX15/CtaA family protein [Bryobacterales bacterium]
MRGRDARFTLAAWIFLGYLLAVILFGAWVRISHSGDGCGSNWPTCHGEVVPTAPSAATLIEYTHRVTSGLCGAFGLALLAWSWVRFRWGRVTRAVALTLLFIVLEGAIGAGLVLAELVANDDSVARAVVIALHLTNTLALTAFAALAAWWSGIERPPAFAGRRRLAFALALAVVVLTAMSGAVTALGDTLFPREVTVGAGLLSELRDDISASSHFLVRLRVLHPALALVAAAYLVWLLETESGTSRWARSAMYLAAAEVALGFFSIALSAPGWLQILHLLAAQALWVALVLACASLDQRSQAAL